MGELHDRLAELALTPIVAFARSELDIHLGQRIAGRTLVIHDRAEDHTSALEGKRLGTHATTELLHELHDR